MNKLNLTTLPTENVMSFHYYSFLGDSMTMKVMKILFYRMEMVLLATERSDVVVVVAVIIIDVVNVAPSFSWTTLVTFVAKS
jgi:hypothetical protein